MSGGRDGLTTRQLRALSFTALLAPALRLIPGWNADAAGSAAWLSPIAALPALLALAALTALCMKNRRPGEGLGSMLRRALGKRAGGALLLLWAAWLAFYAGFLLRSGAERFIATIYLDAQPLMFVLVMLALALTAALGRVSALGRAAELFRPALIAVLAAVLLFALPEADPACLLPVTLPDALPVLRGAASTVDVGALIIVHSAFLDGFAPIEPGRGRRSAALAAASCAMLALLTAAVVGRFGAELTARISYPFFVLVRNTELFGAIERIEALVTALWVLPDFALSSLALIAGALCLRLALGYPATAEYKKPLSLTSGRWSIPLVAAAALAVALTIAPNAGDLEFFSRSVVPYVNLAFCFGALPLALAVGLLRKKI